MPRYVLLEHDHPYPHWDLLLEVGPVLWAWRLERPPVPGRPVAATRTFDHRSMYLDYEGPVSGNRGTVRRHDRGTYAWLGQEDGRLHVRLSGGQFPGRLLLVRQEGDVWEAEYTPE
jgi:hypothetical protein